MKHHIIIREIPYDELENVIEKYEDEGYEVAGLTYREYHYDIVFKRLWKSYTIPYYVPVPEPWDVKPVPTTVPNTPPVYPNYPFHPYCGQTISSTEPLFKSENISSTDEPEVTYYPKHSDTISSKTRYY